MPNESLITGAHLDNSLLALAREIRKTEIDHGENFSPSDIFAVAASIQQGYDLFPNNNPVSVTGLATDIKNALTFVREKSTPSINAIGYHRLRADIKSGEYAFPDVLEFDCEESEEGAEEDFHEQSI
ncbi:hypothetical protein [Alcaligenes sp. Lyrl_28]|uniref:hypothetical protein n=1 Tax=Alcaligenes sp. Lyrl_28 TaxID=3110924 RepID=UPI003F7C849C